VEIPKSKYRIKVFQPGQEAVLLGMRDPLAPGPWLKDA